MANIALFEDQLFAREEVWQALEGTAHEITGQAWSITEAHSLLGQMALGEIPADYALVDGSLGFSTVHPTFRFTPPGLELPEAPKKRWYTLRDKPVINPNEIIVEPDSVRTQGADGRQICRIIRACKLPVVIVGISGDRAADWGGDVDHDLTKKHITDGLLALIERLEAEKTRDS